MNIGVVLLLWLLPLRFGGRCRRRRTCRPAPVAETTTIAALQDLTDDLRARLEIGERVHVTLVDHNPLVMSVETLAGRTGPFVISVDREFIHELSQTRIGSRACPRAWARVDLHPRSRIVQTERLANDIAMRVVSRSAFEPVYEKVWARTGIKGNLIEFIGPPSQTERSPAPARKPCIGFGLGHAGFGAFPNTSTIVAVTVPVFLNVCIAPPLRFDHVPGLDVDRLLSFDRQRELTGQQREHVIGGVGVIVHAAHRARLGPVAQHAEVRPIHHHHRRDARIAGDGAGLFRDRQSPGRVREMTERG